MKKIKLYFEIQNRIPNQITKFKLETQNLK